MAKVNPKMVACQALISPIKMGADVQYIVITITDVSPIDDEETASMRARLQASETFRLLVDTIKDYAIYMIDPQGLILTWNAGARRLKYFTEAEVKGASFAMFYSGEDQALGKPQADLRAALEFGRYENEGWRYRKDGSSFWANMVLTPVYQEERLIGFAKITRDLTERQAYEANLREAYEATSRLKSEFLANMSHEVSFCF